MPARRRKRGLAKGRPQEPPQLNVSIHNRISQFLEDYILTKINKDISYQ
jgi:hypothetical protein